MKKHNLDGKILFTGLCAQAAALLMGIGLHASAILAGRTLFYEKIFTPALDLLFVPFIALGGLLGMWGYVAVGMKSRWLRAAGTFVSIYFLISIPFHVRTLLAWSTAHFAAFPAQYSFFIIPVQLLFLWIVATAIREQQAAPGLRRM